MGALPETITIGELATRSGTTTSALRFYESKGLIESERTEGNQRRYHRSTLRRIATIRAAQSVGLTLEEIASALATLPQHRTAGRSDWERLSKSWRRRLDLQIQRLEVLRDTLTGCIGCGCLSLGTCQLVNYGDRQAANGPGAPGLRVD
ncbi:MAG TPA: redox-sensitive transcriptional activator SoxR [Acidimicrobiia bacterium]|nr:redox-sensitive transcriptional activator SoxR [Acidimicrobiia bacterium]